MESKLKALQKSPRLKCATALQGGAIAYRNLTNCLLHYVSTCCHYSADGNKAQSNM